MAKRPTPKDPAQLREEAKAAAEEAVKVADAHRKKIGARPLSPRESIQVYQAALNEYHRRRAQPREH